MGGLKKPTFLHHLYIFGYRGLGVFATRIAVFWSKDVKMEKCCYSRSSKNEATPES